MKARQVLRKLERAGFVETHNNVKTAKVEVELWYGMTWAGYDQHTTERLD